MIMTLFPRNDPTRSQGGLHARCGRGGAVIQCVLMVAALACWTTPCLAAKPKWDPIDSAELAARDSTANPGVDAEILFSQHTIEDNLSDLIIRHYLRAKVFTRRGVEDRGKSRIVGGTDNSIEAVAARVLKADGAVIELKKADTLRSTVVIFGDEKVPQVAFAFPNLTPGDIVEYQWEEHTSRWSAVWHYFSLFCQESLPVREFRLEVRSYPVDYQVLSHNCSGGDLKKISDGQMAFTVRDLPAFEEEEDMPAQRDFRAWVMIARNDRDHRTDEQWKLVSRSMDEDFRRDTKPSRSVKALAERLVAGAGNDTEKVRCLYEFCRNEIVNFSWNDSPELREAKRKNGQRTENQDPKETLEKRSGRGSEISHLFAGMARDAGFEVKAAWNASRTEIGNIQIPKGWDFLDREMVAVKVDGEWQYFDPAARWIPPGMVDWRDEGVTALLCDAEKVLYARTAVARAGVSQLSRKGRFKLDSEGTLEGTVEMAMTGHLAIEQKRQNWEKAADEIDRALRQQIARGLPTAEVSDIRWKNLRTLELPVTVRYRVRVPGYAEQAGNRLVLAPGYFEVGESVRFAAEKRKFPIFFPYAWAEHDDVEIDLPGGFELEQASSSLDVGDRAASLGATYSLGYKPKPRILVYKRDFALGEDGATAYRAESYPELRRLYEALHRSDTHSIMLKHTVPTSGQTGPGSGPDQTPSAVATPP
jgi:hypothetical protein